MSWVPRQTVYLLHPIPHERGWPWEYVGESGGMATIKVIVEELGADLVVRHVEVYRSVPLDEIVTRLAAK